MTPELDQNETVRLSEINISWVWYFFVVVLVFYSCLCAHDAKGRQRKLSAENGAACHVSL